MLWLTPLIERFVSAVFSTHFTNEFSEILAMSPVTVRDVPT